MDKLKFVILGEPRPKQSARFYKTGKFIKSYQTEEVKLSEYNIRAQIVSQLPKDFKLWDKGIKVNYLHYVFTPIKSVLKQVNAGLEVYKTTKPDVTDNLSKGLFDALQGVVFLNDSQICSMQNVKKVYGLQPKIELELEHIEN